jgi:tryptophan-rich sensory protein
MLGSALSGMPLWGLAIAIVGGFVGVAVGGLALTRRWMRRCENPPNDLAGFVYAVVGVVYAVLLGLSALGAYEHFNEVEHLANREANAVGNLYRDLEGYPAPLRERLQGQLRQYVHLVIEDELPALREGHGATAARDVVDRLVSDWVTVEPRGEGHKLLHGQALQGLNAFLALRRERLQEGQAGLHPIVWFVLLAGAGLTIGFTYLFWAESHQLHGVMVGMLAAMLGLAVFWLAAMDLPLRGPLSISTDGFLDVRAMIDRGPNPAEARSEAAPP